MFAIGFAFCLLRGEREFAWEWKLLGNTESVVREVASIQFGEWMTNAKVGVRGRRLGQCARLRRSFGRCFKTEPRCLDLRISLKHPCNEFSRAQWPLLRRQRQHKRQQAET